LGSPISNDDVVTIALEGFPNKYENVSDIIVHREPFPDIKMARSMLTTEETRLKSRALATSIDSTSSSPMFLLANFALALGILMLLRKSASRSSVPSTWNMTQSDMMALIQTQQTLLAKLGYTGSTNVGQSNGTSSLAGSNRTTGPVAFHSGYNSPVQFTQPFVMQPAHETLFPNGFHAMTLQDPGNWNMDTALSWDLSIGTRAMTSNKDRIENLEAALGQIQYGIAKMKIGFADKFQHFEDIVTKLSDVVLSGKGGDNYKQAGRSTFYSKLTKLEFKTYRVDEDPTEWFTKVDQFFEYQGTPVTQKVSLTSYHLQGEANQWWRWLCKTYQEEGKEVTWEIFHEELWSWFGPTDYEDFDDALSKMASEMVVPDVDSKPPVELRVWDFQRKRRQENFISLGTKVSGGDVITGNTSPISDHRMSLKHSECGLLDQVLIWKAADIIYGKLYEHRLRLYITLMITLTDICHDPLTRKMDWLMKYIKSQW
ncbi:hypothetical protein Tco_1281969, partial [Tanacetum coccineum]